jgi:hypothetical protein
MLIFKTLVFFLLKFSFPVLINLFVNEPQAEMLVRL